MVPDSYDANTPRALVFLFHGAGGNEDASKAFGVQDAPGASDAAIFVFPRGVAFQSYGIGWNDACDGYDMPFFDAMLASLSSDYCIDSSRIFAGGFSWGGDFTTALTCCRGDVLRAVAPASCSDEFANPDDPTSYHLACPKTGTSGIRFTHATVEDSGYPAPYFTTTSKLYRSWNGCASSSNATSPSPCVSYDGCSRPFIECSYDGLGHALPNGWGTDTWNFFATFP